MTQQTDPSEVTLFTEGDDKKAKKSAGKDKARKILQDEGEEKIWSRRDIKARASSVTYLCIVSKPLFGRTFQCMHVQVFLNAERAF